MYPLLGPNRCECPIVLSPDQIDSSLSEHLQPLWAAVYTKLHVQHVHKNEVCGNVETSIGQWCLHQTGKPVVD